MSQVDAMQIAIGMPNPNFHISIIDRGARMSYVSIVSHVSEAIIVLASFLVFVRIGMDVGIIHIIE